MELIMLENGDIKFKQYIITKHSINRYQERTGKCFDEMISCLDQAHLITEMKKGSYLIGMLIRKAENNGRYILKNKNVFFVIQSNTNAVITSLTTQLIYGCTNTAKGIK